MCDAHSINLVLLLEDGSHSELLLELLGGKINLVSDASAIDLDLHNDRALHAQRGKVGLSVGQQTYNAALLFHLTQLLFNKVRLRGLGLILRKSSILLLTSTVADATLDRVCDVSSIYSGADFDTAGSADVTNHTKTNHRWRVDDGSLVNDSLVVKARSTVLDEAHDVRAASLVTSKSGQMALLSSVVSGESPYRTARFRTALLGQEAQVTFSAFGVISVSHFREW